MKPLGPASAKAMAAICGLLLGAFTLVQYAHINGMEPLAWLRISPGPRANTTQAILVAATLLSTFFSFERAYREIGPLAAAAWFGVGSGFVLVLAWLGTSESMRPSYASDSRDALALLAAPPAITCVFVLFAIQMLTLLRFSALRSTPHSSRGLIAGAALLALSSMLIGLGPFRLQLGEWHYVLALWAGDAACVGFLTASRTESLMTPETRSFLIRWTTASVGFAIMLVAVLM